jgi:prepilin-type N-terminal cleavage/methylation domain-containing protein/prepilin-type processing-associated H-X9-DG protein
MTDLPSRTSHAPAPRAGFTLVELLVVIAVIAIVLGLILVGIGRLQTMSRTTACLANQRQIVLANMSYAGDNDGRLVSPRTDSRPPQANMRQTDNCWVNTAVPGAIMSGAETIKSLEAGVLWSYLGQNAKVYASPMDPTGRVRSYSLSAFVGVGERDPRRRANDLYPFPDLDSPDAPEQYRNTQFKTVTLSRIPQPSRTMASIAEEDSAGYNFAGFIIEVAPPAAAPGHWLDAPALWNPGRVNLAYLDGSVEAPAIIYSQLAKLMQPNPAKAPVHGVIEPGTRSAFRFMSTIILPGIVRPELQ